MQLNRAQIPANITTIEQLSVWCALALQFATPNMLVPEGSGSVERAASVIILPVVDGANIVTRAIARTSLVLNPSYLHSAKLWMHAEELTPTALNTNFAA